jgi:hypothetical protein
MACSTARPETKHLHWEGNSSQDGHVLGGGGGVPTQPPASSPLKGTYPNRVLQSKRLLNESRWVSKPLALAGKLRPRRLNKTAVLTHPRAQRPLFGAPIQ